MQQALPLNAKAFMETIFQLTSRKTIFKQSTVKRDGKRTFYLPTIAYLIRGSYHLKQGEKLSGITATKLTKSVIITLEGPMQQWASRNCPRCSTRHEEEAFRRVGEQERAVEVELTASQIKKCLANYLETDSCGLCLGVTGIVTFIQHLNGDLSMHSDTRKRVRPEIHAMLADILQ